MKFDASVVITYALGQLCTFFQTRPVAEVLAAIRAYRDAELRVIVQSSFHELTQDRQNLVFFVAARKKAVGGTAKILTKLAETKMSLSLVDTFGQTPLFYASREQDADAVQVLIKAQCDINRKDLNGQTCLFYAVRQVELDVPRPQSVLSVARRIALVELLISLGCNIHTRDHIGNTAAETYDGKNREIWKLLQFDCGALKGRKPPLRNHWIYRFCSRGDIEYGIRTADASDSAELSALENEFIEDHRKLLTAVWREKPPLDVTCATLGLNSSPEIRKCIITSIAQRSCKLARTLTAVNFTTGDVVGYLYFKCKTERNEKAVEISHLKVKNSSRRQGVGRALFTAVSKYVEENNLEEYGEDLQLSVFDINEGAIALYESMGFKLFDDPWPAEVTWENRTKKDVVPELWWRRYRKCIDASTDTESEEKVSVKKRRRTR